MEQKPFHSSRRQFLQISSLLAIGIVTTPIAQALIATDTEEVTHISRFKTRVNQGESRSLDFDSHRFPLRNYQLKPDPLLRPISLF